MRKLSLLLASLLFNLSLFTVNSANAQANTDSCRANFERLPNTTSNPLYATFKALPWHSNEKRPEIICWHFGDGSDTCINYDPTALDNYIVNHLYEHPGNYNICVRIRYQGGCIAEKCKLQTIGNPDSCHADFETSLIAGTPLGRRFTAIPWHNNNKKPYMVCWRFGDGTDTCIQYPPTYSGLYGVTHIYSAPGNYEVYVIIKYEGGCEATRCRVVQVGNADSCHADFERILLNSTADPLTVHLKAIPSHNHNKKPKTICWKFGDGKDTCINYPENYAGQYVVGHQYNHTGVYNVCVKIVYYGGCEATKCRLTVIGAQLMCSVRLFEMAPSATSLTRAFYIVPASPFPNNRPKRICWYFGDGTDTCVVVDFNSTTPSYSIIHTYPAPGVYKACVKVLFTNGCVAEDCKEVVIRSRTEICGGYQLDSLINPHTYLFKGFSIHNPNDHVVSYWWTFGDGSMGSGQQVTHTYAAPGEYRVCLLINTEKGCESRICNTVRVAGNVTSVLQLSPNPVVNILHAQFYSTHNEMMNIKIINSNGVVVRSYTRNAVIGLNNWDFVDVGSLTPGVYSFIVQSPNQFASAIFFKQ